MPALAVGTPIAQTAAYRNHQSAHSITIMPELPEVETMRRGILPLVGRPIRSVVFQACELKPIEISPLPASFRRRVVGTTVAEVGRIGKRVVVRLDSGDSIVVEPRMTGMVLRSAPPNQQHLRLRIGLGPRAKRDEQPANRRRGAAAAKKSAELLYWDRRGLGSVRLLSPRQLAERYGPEKLGPDALVITPDELQQRLGTSRRAIKVALMDQRAVAGIGNLYASEILHQAGIHPLGRCHQLAGEAWRQLHAAIGKVLRAAIDHEGSTLSDGTYRNALNQAGSYQNHHRVYDRKGQLCRSCGQAKIVRVVQAQRSTFFCPNCQPSRSSRQRPK